MDKRLKLTSKQQQLVDRYNEVVKEMKDANIKAIYRPRTDIFLFNGESVADCDYVGDVEDCDLVVDLDDLTLVENPISFALGFCDEEYVSFKFK